MIGWIKKINRIRLAKRRILALRNRIDATSGSLDAIAIAKLHQKVFEKYKNKFLGRSVVIVASGATLNQYRPIEGAIHIGVNSSIKHEKIEGILDFLFVQDFGAKQWIEKANKMPCKLFLGRTVQWWLHPNMIIPEELYDDPNVEKYYTSYPENRFYQDLTIYPLADFNSVVFSALSFALWTHPKEIYLVGCDCSNRYFDKKDVNSSFEVLIEAWRKAREFRDCFYPDVNIISINPVGLRGMFVDVYQ